MLTKEEEEAIKKAKLKLIHKYHMSEDEAHRYILTKAMNRRIKKVQVAYGILITKGTIK